MELLIKAGADLNAVSKSKGSALQQAFAEKQPGSIVLLAESGANMNVMVDEDSDSDGPPVGALSLVSNVQAAQIEGAVVGDCSSLPDDLVTFAEEEATLLDG